MTGYSQRYFTPYEVACHSKRDNLWISFNGEVYNLTELVRADSIVVHDGLGTLTTMGHSYNLYQKPQEQMYHIVYNNLIQTQQQLRFQKDENELKTWVDPITNLTTPYIPQGNFLHVPPICPTADSAVIKTPWWKNARYWVGHLSERTMLVVLKNVLTLQEHVMEVPVEETIAEIRERYLKINGHAYSYTWKALKHDSNGKRVFEELDMNETMVENGVPDEASMKEEYDIA